MTPDVPGFGGTPFWIVLIKVVGVFVFLVVMTLFAIVFERKVVGRMQNRIGPNRTGPWGTLQSLADGMKLAFKEEIIPALADKPVYFLAPILSAVPAFLAFSVIPFGPVVSMFGHETPLQLTDLPVGVLVVFACSSLGVYGIVLSGWASGSTGIGCLPTSVMPVRLRSDRSLDAPAGSVRGCRMPDSPHGLEYVQADEVCHASRRQ